MTTPSTINVHGRRVEVTNLNKIFYPASGFTKGDVIDYYIKISKVLLPYLKNRPISLKRYPNGVNGFFFYEKRCPSHRPEWIKTAKVPKSEGEEINYCMMNELSSLVWAANLADLELHTFLHKAPAIHRPTAMVFDLDPGASTGITECCEVALWLKAIFDKLKLKSFAKTSGSKGMQIYIPLNTAITYARTKAFSHAVARLIEKQAPERVVTKMQKKLRKGKVFIDWSQNDEHKTTICAYSLRAKEMPSVSTPVTWKEVKEGAKGKRALYFQSKDVLRRVRKYGDIFSPVILLKQRLPLLGKIEKSI